MALRHRNREHDALILQALNATEFQIRLQATSLLAELARSGNAIRSSASTSGSAASGFSNTEMESFNRDKLVSYCSAERHPKVRTSCLAIARGRTGVIGGETAP